ncbi:MAG: lactate/malate family dehydrogenase [Phascolarctobacterium faecium]
MKEKAIGQALDLDDCVSGSLCGKDVSIRAGSYEELHDADIMVMAFGRSRRPDETRLDMFDDSIKMANEVVSHLKQIDFRGIMISISNPADIICEYIRRQMDWQPSAASVQAPAWKPIACCGYSARPPATAAVLFTASVWVSMVIPALSSGHAFLSAASPFCNCAGTSGFGRNQPGRSANAGQKSR